MSADESWTKIKQESLKAKKNIDTGRGSGTGNDSSAKNSIPIEATLDRLTAVITRITPKSQANF